MSDASDNDYDEMFGSSSDEDGEKNDQKHKMNQENGGSSDSVAQCTSVPSQHTSPNSEDNDYTEMFGSDDDDNLEHEGDDAVIVDVTRPPLLKQIPKKSQNIFSIGKKGNTGNATHKTVGRVKKANEMVEIAVPIKAATKPKAVAKPKVVGKPKVVAKPKAAADPKAVVKPKVAIKSSGTRKKGWISREALWADSSSDSDDDEEKKTKAKIAVKRARQESGSSFVQKSSATTTGELGAQDNSGTLLKRARRDSITKGKKASVTATEDTGKKEMGDAKPLSAADVLAMARQRRKKQQVDGDGTSKTSNTSTVVVPKKKTKVINTAPTTVKRSSSLTTILKKKSKGGIGSRLLSAPVMMKRNSSTGQLGSLTPKKKYPKVEVEQYFRSLRDWDFLRDLSDHMLAQQRGVGGSKKKKSSGSEGDEDETDSSSLPPIAKKKLPLSASASSAGFDANSPSPLPDKFESSEQYKALWAPLLLDEVKSQIMSDASATSASTWARTGGSGGGGALVRQVTVVPVNPADVNGYNEAIDVVVRGDGGGPGRGSVTQVRGRSGGMGTSPADSFSVNDAVLLFSELSSIVRAATGKLTDEESKAATNLVVGAKGKRLGFVGHAVNHRNSRSVDGLILKVSRRLWRVAGQNEMYMVRVGGSVTAIREFTALCRVDKIPLTKYLLGGNTSTHSEAMMNKSSEDLLSTMSGQDSLGIGFRIYVKSKFNRSQLGAITAAAREYGDGGFTLVKGPPGTGKTTTLVALLNALHLRQYQRYYNEIERITTSPDTSKESTSGPSLMGIAEEIASFNAAAKVKPRILVCAPSNAAVDNVILKIMEDRFVDGNGGRYGPSIVRVGVGQSSSVKDVNLKVMIDTILEEGADVMKLQSLVVASRKELSRIQKEVRKLKQRVRALASAVSYTLSRDWEIRIDEESFDMTGRVIFINHKTKTASVDPPPPVQPGETPYPTKEMPHYKGCMDALVKYVERQNNLTNKLEQYIIVQNTTANLKEGLGRQSQETALLIQQLETQILDSMHIVLTTLGSAGSRVVESAEKFEVVVVDEAAQSSEPASLVALQLGSSHAILVGDPQQLPATIFSVSGRTTKYDRSLFQRLEESGHPVHMLDTQYRMDKNISEFPRRIFYDGRLLDGPNVQSPDYGGELRKSIRAKFKHFQPFTIFDLDSAEERDGTSLSNVDEAQLALHLYKTLEKETDGISSKSRTAIITPYSQQVALLRRTFAEEFGERYSSKVEISTVDAFQGKESKIVIFSCVRGAGRGVGIGFLSDVQRMNVALTRAKHFLFVIARCRSIMVNPYWRDLVAHARERRAIIKVPMKRRRNSIKNTGKQSKELAVDLKVLTPLHPVAAQIGTHLLGQGYTSGGEFSA